LGIGRIALDFSRDLMPNAVFVAEVLPNNQASRALFQSAGYSAGNEYWFVSKPKMN